MKASIFEMTMNDQILRQQNRDVEKQNQKKSQDRRVEDAVEVEVSQEETHAHSKQKKQQTLITKRRRVAEALNKRSTKSSKPSSTAKSSHLSKGKKLVQKGNVQPELNESDNKESTLKQPLHPAVEHMIRHFTVQVLGKNLGTEKEELEDLEFLEESDLPSEKAPADVNPKGHSTAPTKTNKTKNTKLPEKAKNSTKTKNRADAKPPTKAKPAKLVKQAPKPMKTKKEQAVQKHLSKLSPKDKKEYLSKILNGTSNEILDTLFDPKYLIGCKQSPKQLKEIKKKVRNKARSLRKMTARTLPSAIASLEELGFGDFLGSIGNNIRKASSEKKSEDPNDAILEAMVKSLDLTQLLQELGVKTDLVELGVQSTVASDQVKTAKSQAKKNVEEMHKNIEHAACEKAIKILSYIAAAVLIIVGQPEAGLLMIAATSGLITFLITKLASALDISPFALKCIIMAITIIITVLYASPQVMGEEAVSALSSFTQVMLIASTIGFTTDLLGVIATGKDDPSKYPSWVTWTAFGINMSSMLPELGTSIYRAVTKGLAKMASRIANEAVEEVENAEVALSSATKELESSGGESLPLLSSEINLPAESELLVGNVAEGASSGLGGEAGALRGAASGLGGESSALSRGVSGAEEDVESSSEYMSAVSESNASASSEYESAVSTAESVSSASSDSASFVTAPSEESVAQEVVQNTSTSAQNSAESGLNSEESTSEEVSSTSRVRGTQGGASRAQTVEEVASTTRAVESEARLAGDDESQIGIDTQGGTTGRGQAAWATDQTAGDTEIEEEAKDPLKEKIIKMEKLLDKAKADLDRLTSLEEASEGAASKETSELAGQVKSAQEEVDRLTAKVAELARKAEAYQSILEGLNSELEEASEEASSAESRLQALRNSGMAEDSPEMQEALNAEREAKESVQSIQESISNTQTAKAEIARGEELQAVTKAQNDLVAAKAKLAKAQKSLEQAESRLLKEAKVGDGKIARLKAYLNSKFGEFGKLLLLVDSGAEAYAEGRMAEIDHDLGEIMADIAELTGNYDLLNSFFEIIGAVQQETSQRNQQYSKDMHDEIKLVGDIINSERRAAMALMSA
ncbi:MAG: hypothetical protein S4CHLAM7_04950 [Chlamydiae bacterium]|nr:hypothetical protein [Chlamydiota bacterium]